MRTVCGQSSGLHTVLRKDNNDKRFCACCLIFCLILDKIVLYAQTTRQHNIELFALMKYIYCVLERKRISVKPNVLAAYCE